VTDSFSDSGSEGFSNFGVLIRYSEGCMFPKRDLSVFLS
jgi:hypothetical protein